MLAERDRVALRPEQAALPPGHAWNRLPMHYHPLFRSTVFERVTDDAFFISIESWDPRFDAADTRKLLESLGARSVELVES